MNCIYGAERISAKGGESARAHKQVARVKQQRTPRKSAIGISRKGPSASALILTGATTIGSLPIPIAVGGEPLLLLLSLIW